MRVATIEVDAAWTAAIHVSAIRTNTSHAARTHSGATALRYQEQRLPATPCGSFPAMTVHVFDGWRGRLPASAAFLLLGCGASASSDPSIAFRGDRNDAEEGEQSESGGSDDDSTIPSEDDPAPNSNTGDAESASGGATPTRPPGSTAGAAADGSEEVDTPARPADEAPSDLPNGTSTEEPSVDDPPDPVPAPMRDPSPQDTCIPPEPGNFAEISERLQRLIWGTDEELLEPSALSDDLPPSEPPDPELVRRLAAQMLRDESKGRVGLKRFVHDWLQLDAERLSMDDSLLQSTLESTERTLDFLLFEPSAPLSALYSGDQAVANAELATFYGIPTPDDEWGIVQLPEPRRVGLLGQAFWLNVNHHPATRGTVVMNSLRCLGVPPPPPGLEGPPREEPATDVTRREQYLAELADPACFACHALFDPVGLTFEHFDAWGEYRTTDNGFEVDATGSIPRTTIEVDGAADLAAALAGELREETHACISIHATAYSLGLDQLPPNSEDDDDGCYAIENPELAALEDPLVSDWILELVASPMFLAAY